jgi:transposase
MSTQFYATDLTDAEWDLIQPLLPAPAHTGRPRLHSWNTMLNAIFYQLCTRGAWRFPPQEWPPW